MKPHDLKAVIDIVTEAVELRLGIPTNVQHEMYARRRNRDDSTDDSTDPVPGWPNIARQLYAEGRVHKDEFTALEQELNSRRTKLPEFSFGKSLVNWYNSSKLIGLDNIICRSPESLELARKVAQIAVRVFGPGGQKLSIQDVDTLESFLDDIEPMTLTRDMPVLTKARNFLKQANGMTGKDLFSVINSSRN